MASGTKAAPAKKTPAKAPAKAPAKPVPGKPTGKPAIPSPAGKAPQPAAAPAGKIPLGVKHAADEETPAVVPKMKLEKHGGSDTLCQIEIVKDGHFFIARTQTDSGGAKEYKNTVFEDLLTEMVITLQEQLADH
jgi:hypothetical protein